MTVEFLFVTLLNMSITQQSRLVPTAMLRRLI